MKFHNLHIENFLTLRSANVNLEDRGLQLVQGVNDDDSSASSNGAGKSSMVDAICWCLFGVTAREVKGDAVVNLAAKKDCRVTLNLTNGESAYRVMRHRKHTTGKNTLVLMVHGKPGEEMTDLSRGTDAETQKLVEKVLGCSYEVFKAAVYCGQEAMPDLPRMKDRELKTLIEEAAGLQRIEKAYELARERGNAAKGLVSRAELDVDNCKAENFRSQQTHEKMGETFQAWEDGRTLRVKETRKVLDLTVDKYRAAALLRDEQREGSVEAALSVTSIDDKLACHKADEGRAALADRAVRAAELSVDTGTLKYQAAEVAKYQARISNAETEVKRPCSQCGTLLESMTVEDFVAHETKHLTAAKATLEASKVEARKVVLSLVKLREEAAEARAKVPDVSALILERAKKVTLTVNFDGVSREVSRLTADAKAAKAQLDLRTSEPNPHASTLVITEKNVVDAASRLAASLTTSTLAVGQAAIAAAVVKVFGPAGVRAQILDTVTPFLNEATGNYLSALSDGEISATWTTLTKSATGDLKEKFSIDVTHSKGGDSFAALSGGEKRKVRLATALALQDLVASRATQSIEFAAYDEIDDALDSAGLERLMVVLERKTRERGTVLVISHSNLKDWVDEVTTVTKSGLWSSTVSGSLCIP
jgi:hypothetical protein